MAVDLYERRAMARMLSQQKPPRTFIRDTFFKNHEEYDVENIDVDIETGARRMAPFVSPRVASKTVDMVGYKTSTYKAPTVAQKTVLNVQHLQNRLPGEALYEQRSPEEREAILLSKGLSDLDGMLTRREEKMSADALFTGQIHVIGEGVDEIITFPRPAGNVIALPAAALRWGGASADIIKNFRDWKRIAVKSCGMAPDIAILGSLAADALLADANLRLALDTRRIDLGIIEPKDLGKGVTYLGQLRGTGIDLYSYDEWYIDPEDPAAAEQAMVPEKQVLLGSSTAYTALRYGAVPVATGSDSNSSLSLVIGARIPDSWVQKEPAARFIKLSSRPLPVPIQIGAFVVATVLL
jgi:hypothetical protein